MLREKVRVVLLHERREASDLAAQVREPAALEDVDEAPENRGGGVVVEPPCRKTGKGLIIGPGCNR